MLALHRRLLDLACGLAALAFAGTALAAAPVRVAEGVYLLRDGFDPGRQPDGNSIVFVGPRGLVLVDTGRHAAHAQALLDFAAARAQPIVLVVNTHWHLDHLGGNALLRERVPGLKIIASDAVAPAFAGWLAESRRDMQALLDGGRADDATRAMVEVDIALIDAGPRLVPDVALSAPRTTVEDGGRRLLVGLTREAVSGADLWVFDAASRVVAAGDLVTLPVPFLDTACAPRWRTALAEIDALPFETLIPGHGAPMTRADFARWRSAFGELLDCAAGTASARSCADGWIAGIGALLPADERGRARAMLDYYVGEQLRAAPAQRDRFCAAPAGKAP
jgi:glyoxylase-like metal-dependent hydrolase (beta-lactamase superfamily II)